MFKKSIYPTEAILSDLSWYIMIGTILLNVQLEIIDAKIYSNCTKYHKSIIFFAASCYWIFFLALSQLFPHYKLLLFTGFFIMLLLHYSFPDFFFFLSRNYNTKELAVPLIIVLLVSCISIYVIKQPKGKGLSLIISQVLVLFQLTRFKI